MRAVYPGASAQTVANTVTQVIEQQMTGLDGMRYMSSNSSSAGSASITLTFETGTDPDIAQVQVQNKLSQATPLLPESVQRQGVTVQKSAAGFLMVISLISPDGSYDETDLADYMQTNLVDDMSRIEGVGSIQVFGSQYAMRIWLDPAKLTSYGLTPSDVTNAVSQENSQISAGAFGTRPTSDGQMLNATITAQSLLQTPEDFRQIVLRAEENGGLVLLGDVAEVEIGAQGYDFSATYNGQPATGMAISLASGANALDVSERVYEQMEEYAEFFPEGVDYVIPYDTTPFVEISIESVMHTLIEAIVLVFLVMYLFLQNFRATLIPTLAVPVVLLGTFGILALFGFSINTLTMLAMVLAIGLLVDDAIVVVENVERIMEEEGLSPLEATRKSMGQITGALIGIALVLSAVYVPMAFFGGSTGVIYQQFSITIVSAMGLSVLVALTLTPALCATLLTAGSRHQARFLRPVQPRLQRHDPRLRRACLRDREAAFPHGAGLCRTCGGHGLHVHAHAHGLPARGRPGDHVRDDPGPDGRHAGTDRSGHRPGRGALPRKRERGGRGGLRRGGLRLCRPGAEHGSGLRADEGLERAGEPRAVDPGRRGPRLWRALARSRMPWSSRSCRRP